MWLAAGQQDHREVERYGTRYLYRSPTAEKPVITVLWNTVRHIDSLSLSLSLSVRFNGHFPDGSELASTRMSSFWILLEQRMMEVVVTTGAIRRTKLQSNRHHQQTNIQLFTGRMSFLSPNQQCQSTELIWSQILGVLQWLIMGLYWLFPDLQPPPVTEYWTFYSRCLRVSYHWVKLPLSIYLQCEFN